MDGKQLHCLRDGAGWLHENGRVHATFELPLDSNVLYAFSRGGKARGSLVVRQDDRDYSTDKVLVDVAAVRSTSLRSSTP